MRRGGSVATPGIQTLQAAAVAAALALVYLACRVQSAALPSMAILVLGFFVLEPRVIPRPASGLLRGDRGLLAGSFSAPSPRARRGRSGGWCRWSRCGATCTSSACSAWLFIGLFALAEFARPSALARREAAPRADGRRQRRGRDAGEPIRLGAPPLPLRERDGAADAQHRRARPSLPPGIPRVLRRTWPSRRCSCLSLPRRLALVGSARGRPVRCARATAISGSRRSSFLPRRRCSRRG